MVRLTRFLRRLQVSSTDSNDRWMTARGIMPNRSKTASAPSAKWRAVQCSCCKTARRNDWVTGKTTSRQAKEVNRILVEGLYGVCRQIK